VYQPISDFLAQKGLPFIDAGPRFVDFLGDSDLKTLYSPKTNYHLNENSNAVLAKLVYDWLTQYNFLPGAQSKNYSSGEKTD